MTESFTSEFFAGNRARLRQLFAGTAPIVITANGLLQQTGDSTFPFAQDSSFWYLTGIEEPDIVLVMDKGKEYLIVPERDAKRTAFDGAIDEHSLVLRSGIEAIFDEKEGWRQLSGRLKRAKHVATLAASPAYFEHLGMYSNPARAHLIEKLRSANSELELLDLREHLARLRVIKQPVELSAIQQAIDITIDGLRYVTHKSRLPKYAYEYEIEADLSREFRRAGASGHAFSPIVAGGDRACALHNIANDSAIAADELVVIDVGAKYAGYAADITRTVVLSQPSKRATAVHEAVQEVQKFSLSLLKPGVLMKEYEQQVEQVTGEHLRELGLIKTIDHESVRRFYPHATSHFLGLDVHDVGSYDQPLEPGMVLTCEPGIYISEEGIGVRIEDDVLITPDGCKVLSDRLPRAPA